VRQNATIGLALMTDQRIEKWTRWIDGTIKNNVITMHLQRHAWREVSKILQDNGQLPESYWWQFMRETYGHSQAVAVRRQADTHKDVASLGKLLVEIRDDPSSLTRELWLGLWKDLSDPIDRHFAEKAWADQYGASVGTHLDPAIPTADFDALAAAATDVRKWVNKHVAHADASAVSASVTLTLKDIHDAVDVIGRLFQRYYTLFTAASMIELVPILDPRWKAVFREPWIRPGTGFS
jgi:AbiU2